MLKYILILTILSIPLKSTEIKEYEINGYIELNHKYAEDGSHSLDQYIIWKWYPHLGRHHVVKWYTTSGRVQVTEAEFAKRISLFMKAHGIKELPEDTNLATIADRTDWVGDPKYIVEKKDGCVYFTNIRYDKIVRVKLTSFIETTTQYDPEMIDRDYIPMDKREIVIK